MKPSHFIGILIFVLSSVCLKAQTWETGIGMGIADEVYTGFPQDLFKFRGQLLQAQFKRNFDHYWSGKLGFQYGNFVASAPSEAQVTAQIEFNFFRYETGAEKRPFSPFITAGFSSNPKFGQSVNTLTGLGVKYNVLGNWNLIADYQLASGKADGMALTNYKFASLSLTYTFVRQCCPLDVTQKRRRR